MRLGVLSDVHGNRTALEAVLTDGRDRGVQAWWALGDLAAVGPDPVDTLELLANVPGLVATRGNTERYVLTGDRPPPHPADVRADPALAALARTVEVAFSWTRTSLASGRWLPWLAELPLEVRIDLDDGTRLLGVHASPGRDDGGGITPDRPDGELRTALAGARADVVVAGHTHQPTDRRLGDVRALNCGSVSNPVTTDLRPGYLIVHGDRHGHRIEHRRVAYDRDAFLRCLRRSDYPDPDYIASFQRGEHGRFPARRPGAPSSAG